MNHKYLPHTEDDVQSMLEVLRLGSLDALFTHIPANIRYRGDYDLPPALSESQLRTHLANSGGTILTSFRGFGAYDHERPSIIDALSSRQEFLTSYTPYQPEVAQGTLQYIFEFQSVVCELTGLDVSNASMYDGATAAAEAMMMAVTLTGKPRVLISASLLPHVLEVLKTYAHFREVRLDIVETADGCIDKAKLDKMMEEPFAALMLAYPNRYGIVEDLTPYAQSAHDKQALLIAYADLVALSIFKTPAHSGADICCGEAQSLGLPLSFGGPYLGYLATINKYVRKMPGRICGMTTDNRGQRAYVLTLQAREQHIRRDKANSNICSNQSLMALQATIYAVAMGKKGLQEVAKRSIAATHYLADRLVKTNLFKLSFASPYAYEVTLDYKKSLRKLNELLLAQGYLGPHPLTDHQGVFYASEKMTKDDIDLFVAKVTEADHEIR